MYARVYVLLRVSIKKKQTKPEQNKKPNLKTTRKTKSIEGAQMERAHGNGYIITNPLRPHTVGGLKALHISSPDVITPCGWLGLKHQPTN